MPEILSRYASQRLPAEPATRTQTSLAIKRLRAEIISGRLKPNEKLRVLMLAERYQLGPSPLREALSRLVTDGLVEAYDQRGFRVSPISREDLIDLTESRCGIECLALGASIKLGDVAWESDVLAAFHRLSHCPLPTKITDDGLAETAWAECHREFHRMLIAACRSEWLMYFSGLLYEQSERYRTLAAISIAEKRTRDVPQEHEDIMRAVIGRDTDAACALVKQHFWQTTNIILGVGEMFA